MRLIELEKTAIERIKAFEPDDGYYLCYSGGKDSDCIRILSALAGVKHDIVNNHTTVDAPETVRYIRTIPNIQINYPEITMWDLIVEKRLPPTRLMRYCCEVFKEHSGTGRVKMTGVRWAESQSRAESGGLVKIIGKPKTNQKLAEDLGAEYTVTKQGGIVMNDDNDESRRLVEQCYRTSSAMVNPIVDWQTADVWRFLRYYGCEGNPLYQCGYSRVGCVGCPMSARKGMMKGFNQYPKYRANYVRAFDRMIAARIADGMPTQWKNGEECMRWWVEDSNLDGQLDLYGGEIGE